MIVLMMACEATSDPAAECVEVYSADAGYGWESDPSYGVDAQTAASECDAESGSDCDDGDFITRDAALCIAEVEGLSEGVTDWQAGLVYHHGYSTVVWNVVSKNIDESDYAAGETISLHATTAESLGETSWEATP